jgi:HPt (histidine-containing phosphotransfer) domain-containing protein
MAEAPLNPTQIATSDWAEPPVLDSSMFQELFETLAGDLDMVVSIYRTFFVTAVTLIDSLPRQNCATQARTLHTLKGSAAMLGAARFAQTAAGLQQVAANGGERALDTRIADLSSELDRVRSEALANARSLGYRSEL